MKPALDELISNARRAADKFLEIDQEQTDKIVKAAYEAGYNNRINLAKHAWEETGIGKWEDKVKKNIIGTHYVYHDIKDMKTVGIISEDHENGIVELAKPLGPIFATTPVTNPTSTVLFKILIALKTRNPLIISPHGAARKCTIEAAQICYDAAIEAGAPENCIQWVRRAAKDEILELMSHKRIALILATGSVGLVKAAFSSGNPAIGIGPGNVPVYLGKSANVNFAVEQIIYSKTFDNGTICASEQALIAPKVNSEKIKEELRKQKAYFLSPDEIKKLEPVAFNIPQKVMSASVIGQTAHRIAEMAGFSVPEDTSILIAELDTVGLDSPLSLEILAPILAYYEVDGFAQGIEQCRNINRHGGLGHTVSIFSKDDEKVRYFASVMNAGRIIVNTPSSQGALGGTFNTLQPSLTLSCGTGGNNLTTDNISARHLLNIQRIAYRKIDDCVKCTDFYSLDENITAKDIDDKCKNIEKENKVESCNDLSGDHAVFRE